MSAAFDTFRLARTLRDKAHFTTEQAQGMAEALQGDLATTADVLGVRKDLSAEIASVCAEIAAAELRLEAKIEATTSNLIKWVVGMIGFQTIVLLGAALALARVLTK